jgi:hypothetical protein
MHKKYADTCIEKGTHTKRNSPASGTAFFSANQNDDKRNNVKNLDLTPCLVYHVVRIHLFLGIVILYD